MRGRGAAGVDMRWAAALGLALVTCVASGASAATTINPAGFEFDDADIFKPTVDPGPFLSIYDSRTVPRGRFTLGFWADYARAPFSALQRSGGQESNVTVVDNLGVASLVAAIGLTERFELGLHLPLYLLGESDVQVGSRALGGTDVNLGDVTVNGKVRLYEGRFGLALIPAIGLPTGNRRSFSGLGDWSYGGTVAADAPLGRFDLGANFGGLVRDGLGGRGSGDHFEDLIRWGLAASTPLTPKLRAIAEIYGQTDPGSSGEFRSPVELLGALRFNVGKVDLTVGAGGGLDSAKNAATFRMVVGATSTVNAPRFGGGPPTQFAGSRKTYVVEDYDRNGQVTPGDVIVYTITVVNGGATSATDVVVTDPIPADTDYQLGTVKLNSQMVPDGQAYSPAPPAVRVALGTLAPNGQATVSFKARIRTGTATIVTVHNQARVSAAAVGSFDLPPVDTPVFPVTAEREHVTETPRSVEGMRKLQVTQNIRFHDRQADIDPESFPVLDEVVSILKSRPSMLLSIIGHTDNQGDPQANLKLSQQRADTVKSYLVAKGIEARRLNALGRGGLEPVAANTTESGRAANQRVEFVVMGQ